VREIGRPHDPIDAHVVPHLHTDAIVHDPPIDMLLKVLTGGANAYSPDKTQEHNRNRTTRGLLILVALLTARDHNRIFRLCYYFATTKQL
jgi:hypothetical protein